MNKYLALIQCKVALTDTITLYRVEAPQPTGLSFFLSEGATFAASAIGVGADGRTTYVEEIGITKEVYVEPSTTFTTTSVTVIPTKVTG